MLPSFTMARPTGFTHALQQTPVPPYRFLFRLLACFLGFATFATRAEAGVIVTDGLQYVEISGIYYFNFFHGKNLPYHDLLQPHSNATQTSSVSDQSSDVYAQLTGAASVSQTVIPDSSSATSLTLNSHAQGTALALAADFAQSYNFGSDYLLFTLDTPQAFTLAFHVLADSSRQGSGNSQASAEAYLQLVGATDYVDFLHVDSNDGAGPADSSHSLDGVLAPGSYKLWTYSFASGFGNTGFSSSQDGTGSVILAFPSDPGPPGAAVPEPGGLILLSFGGMSMAVAGYLRRRKASLC